MKTGYQGCVRAVRRKLDELRPELVHGQGTERDCAVSAVLSGRPNVLTVHGHMARIAEITRARTLSYYWLAAKLERFCLRRTRGVIAISSYTRNLVSAHASRTWLVPNAVDPSFFDLRRSPGEGRRILCPAHVSPWKNQVALIDALAPLAREAAFELRFAGAADPGNVYGATFLAKVAQHPWCTLLGKVDRSGLQEELASAAMVVLPSLEDNCPMVVLEAAAAGVPVAASRIGGIPDLVRHGETGLLFDAGSPAGMREAVGTLLGDRALAAVLATHAKQEAAHRFSITTIARSHVEIYREVLSVP
jgi:glycosyltransferase involved in cell wall biosynthesis